MTVLLQLTPAPMEAQPRLVDYNGTQTPFRGGPVSHVERLGSRMALEVRLPPMRHDTALAMAWIADLLRGKRDGVIFEWPQPDYDPPPNGAINIAVGDLREDVSIKGLGAGVPRRGSFFSVIHAGRRYLHNIYSIASLVGGVMTGTVTPPFRTTLAVDDVVEMDPPMIQGYLEGDTLSWTLDVARTVGLSFTIVEEE